MSLESTCGVYLAKGGEMRCKSTKEPITRATESCIHKYECVVGVEDTLSQKSCQQGESSSSKGHKRKLSLDDTSTSYLRMCQIN
jgi:hypothetical protein